MKEQWSKIIECAEAQKDLIIETADHIWANPEIGYKVISSYVPFFKDKEEYFSTVNSIAADFRAVEYLDDGKIVINVGKN